MRFIMISWLVLAGTVFAGDSKRVGSMEELEKAAQTAKPGDMILIENGSYGEPGKVVAGGRFGNPVLLRAETPGKVVFTEPVEMSGSWLTLEGVSFRDRGSVTIKGTGIRMSRAVFSNCGSPKWVEVRVGSKQVEIDRCLFEDKEVNRSRRTGCQLLQIHVLNRQERHHIHHNHFRKIDKGKGSNGFETIQLITRGNPFDPPGGDCATRIEDNLFEECNGEGEIISVKSNGNLLRRNTFRACRGDLTLRHGHRNVVVQNFFFGDEEKGSGGVRLQGRDQVVANNHFHGLGSSAITMMDGTPDKLYMPVERAHIEHNTVVDCAEAMVIGRNHSQHPNGKVPSKCVIAGNAFVSREAKAGLIRYVQGDIPEAWVWDVNCYAGVRGIGETSGLIARDPALKLVEGSLAVPTAETPTRLVPDAPEILEVDAMGRRRLQPTAVGALEHCDEAPAHRPLTAEDVGPHS